MTATHGGSRPQLRDSLELQMLPDGCAILDSAGEAVHILNASAAYILFLCDGTRTSAEIAHELAGSIPELSVERAGVDVETALTELLDKKLIDL